MLQSLSDLFLVISSDTQKITNNDLIIFYSFIIKKIPQIEQQFPLILSKSLSNKISSNLSEEKRLDNNENKINKNNNSAKKLFIHFQKQIFSLFSEIISFCFKEGIIKINNKILKEKDLIKAGFNSSKGKTNLQKDKEIQKFLIHAVIHKKVNCIIYPVDFIKFFNYENAIKNRIYAERFMKFIKHMKIIYKESKKHSNSKKIVNIEKRKSNTEKKISNTERIIGSNNISIERKNKLTFKIIKKFGNQDSNKNITSSDKSIIENNDEDDSLDDNYEDGNDTISDCTPKYINKKFLIEKKGRKTKKINNNFTMNVLQSKNNFLGINNIKYSSQRNSYFLKNQIKNLNIINNKLETKNYNYKKKFFNDSNEFIKSTNNNSKNILYDDNCFIRNNYSSGKDGETVGCNVF